jgi:hypothetical protein
MLTLYVLAVALAGLFSALGLLLPMLLAGIFALMILLRPEARVILHALSLAHKG